MRMFSRGAGKAGIPADVLRDSLHSALVNNPNQAVKRILAGRHEAQKAGHMPPVGFAPLGFCANVAAIRSCQFLKKGHHARPMVEVVKPLPWVRLARSLLQRGRRRVGFPVIVL